MSDPQQLVDDSAALALQALQYEFVKILTKVNINEETFRVTLENNESSILEKLQVIINELNALKHRVASTEYVFLLSISDKIIFLTEVFMKLSNGKYFTSIENLFTSENIPLDTVDVTLFDRTYEITCRQVNAGYKNTADGAIEKNNVVTDSKSRSNGSQSSHSGSGPSPLDIFGVDGPGTESAHLMPNSPNCASLWYHFVSWVLCRLEQMLTKTSQSITPTDRWNYFQKCIHGFTVNKNRANGVGIRHFLTNRIQLKDQKLYLDKWPCLLIIPILSIDEVKNWNGTGYSAIVVAGEYELRNKRKILAATVYQQINAHQGYILFADEQECNTARLLLEAMVLCICKSSRDTFTDEFRRDTLDVKYYQGSLKESPIYIKRDVVTAPVPMSRMWNSKNRVRKVTFSASNQSNMNPAPDPVLLLGKATSIWLKRQGLFVLPGCDSDDDDDDDNSSCCSSNAVASLHDEMDIHECSSIVRDWRPVTDILEPSCLLDDNVDEPLSDSDE